MSHAWIPRVIAIRSIAAVGHHARLHFGNTEYVLKSRESYLNDAELGKYRSQAPRTGSAFLANIFLIYISRVKVTRPYSQK